jgi:hypothetical protein
VRRCIHRHVTLFLSLNFFHPIGKERNCTVGKETESGRISDKVDQKMIGRRSVEGRGGEAEGQIWNAT